MWLRKVYQFRYKNDSNEYLFVWGIFTEYKTHRYYCYLKYALGVTLRSAPVIL